MAERLTRRLRQKAAGIWEAQHQHPFVRGIGDGTLSLERFKFWLRQDYVFLIEYARLLALAAARSPELETMTTLRHAVQGNCGNRDEPAPGRTTLLNSGSAARNSNENSLRLQLGATPISSRSGEQLADFAGVGWTLVYLVCGH